MTGSDSIQAGVQANFTGMRSPYDLAGIKSRVVLSDYVGRFVELKKAGSEFKGISPFTSEKNPSFTVNDTKGFFHCFSSGKHGDVFDFEVEYNGVELVEAYEIVARSVGMGRRDDPLAERVPIAPVVQRKVDEEPEWSPIRPVPTDAPAPRASHFKFGSPAKVWTYLDQAGLTLGYIYRFERPDGGKEVIPLVYATDGSRVEWRWLSFGKPRPLYGLELLAATPTANVVLAEGEKAADAVRALLPQVVGMTWPGGGKAVKHADLEPLRGRKVIIWPDVDLKAFKTGPMSGHILPALEQAGMATALELAARLDGIAAGVRILNPLPVAKKDGWDAADALAEGWTPEQTMDWLKGALRTPADLRMELDSSSAATQNSDPDRVAAVEPSDFVEHSPAASTPAKDLEGERSPMSENPFFKILGHDRDAYYIFQRQQRQVRIFGKGDLTTNGFLELGPLAEFWEMHFPKKSGGFNRDSAVDQFLQVARARGVYDARKLRGRGAWLDDARNVVHIGNSLIVDGELIELDKMKSRYVYEQSRVLPSPADVGLSDQEGLRLLEVAQMFRWSKPASAALLCGWVALAPLCGAFRWRPHIWLTGGAGTGKSSILESFIAPLLGDWGIYAMGNSTEAGLRQELKGDALPVLFDESEQNEEADVKRIQNVMSLIRQASSESGAQTFKGTVHGASMHFHIRSMFCLASIQVGMKQQADIERMTVLGLRPKKEGTGDAEAQDRWQKIVKPALYEIVRDNTLGPRLLRRAVNLLPTTLKNIDVFTSAAAKKFGSQREGDQYGTLMAGTWSLTKSTVATEEQAANLFERFDWSEHLLDSDVDESDRALGALLGSILRLDGGSTITVGELIAVAGGSKVQGVSVNEINADTVLRRYGLRVWIEAGAKWFLVANSNGERQKLFKDTPYAADLRSLLKRVKGATTLGNKSIQFPAGKSKVIAIPLAIVLSGIITTEDACIEHEGHNF